MGKISLTHTDNRKKNILVLSESLTDGLDDTTTTAETKYSANITKSRKKICLSLPYSAANNFLKINGVQIYQFKTKDFEVNKYPLCLRNISKDFKVDNMKKNWT